MAKSRAEIQAAYRARKKATEGKEYFEKESKRVLKYYVPAFELSPRELRKRRMKNLERQNRHIAKIKAQQVADNVAVTPDTSSGTVSQRKLVISLPAVNRRTKGKASYKLSNAVKKARELQVQVEKYKKLWEKERKRAQRSVDTPTPSTPKSQTRKQMKSAGLDPSRHKAIRKRLLFGNVIAQQIRQMRHKQSRKSSLVHTLVSGKVVKKYKMIGRVSDELGFSRRVLGRVAKKEPMKPGMKTKIVSELQKRVVTFLEREDNSRMLPGKQDSKRVGIERKQKRVLTDYMYNLCIKFDSENLDMQISRATFCRLRPSYILLVRFTSRTTCLCVHHQNMALILKCLRKHGAQISENPQNFLKEKDSMDIDGLLGSLPDPITFPAWRKVVLDDKSSRTKIIDVTQTRDEFTTFFRNKIADFEKHVFRLQQQFMSFKTLKEQLHITEVAIQMDFAENYVCQAMNEVQSAYWNQSGVTLHPIVMYYKTPLSSDVQHKSYLVVSDETSHGPWTVCAIIEAFLDCACQFKPDIRKVHYWTDSPTSQYRNKTMFHLIATHKSRYGLDAQWNYFEAGHGKGACDGVGGSAKRSADEAVRSGKALIQDAGSFFAWADQLPSLITPLFVSTSACQTKATEQQKYNIKPVPGTMKLHAIKVHPVKEGVLLLRDTSCYCKLCIRPESTCDTWQKHKLLVTTAPDPPIPQDSMMPADITIRSADADRDPVSKNTKVPGNTQRNQMKSLTMADLGIGDYVAATYDAKWYIGKVVEIDEEEQEIQVSFMVEKKNRLFQWPARDDSLWLSVADILYKVSEPQAKGQSKRMYQLLDEEVMAIQRLFDSI